MGKPLRVLIVEDSEDDVLLTVLALKKGGYDPVFARVEDAGAMRKALEEKKWDVILCDYKMPQFNGLAAIALLKETAIDIPLIIVSGAIGEETAVECMRLGAHDYIMKGNLPRLVPAVERELKEAAIRREVKLASEELRKSEEKYRFLAETMVDMVWTVNMDLQTTYVSPSIFRVLGLTQEERMKQALSEIMTQKSIERVAEMFILEMERAREEGVDLYRSATLDLEYYHKDGSTIWFENVMGFIGDDQGNPMGIHGVSRNITERKRAEEALKESEGKYRSFTDSTSDMVFLKDDEFKYIMVNHAYLEFYKCNEAEILGKTFLDFMPEKRVRDCHASDIQVRESNKLVVTIEQDEDRIVETRKYPVRLKEGKIGVGGIVRDITESKRMEDALRKSEANYRQLFDNAPAGIYQVNFRTGKFVKANDFICEYLGCSQEEITSLSPYDFITKEGQKLLTERLNKMAIGEKVPEDPEYEIVNRNGKRRWLKLNVKNMYDSEGIAGADVVAHDITDRKRSEEALKRSEGKYRAIFENAIEGIYQATTEGRYVSVNPAFAKILGYKTPEELISSITDVASQVYVNPDERSELIKQLSVSDLVEEFEFQASRKDGTIIWLLANARVIRDEYGNIEYFEGRVQDITQRKCAEENLKHTLESLRKAFGATIQVMVSAVETRDPYTAGHQSRSADLSRAIATEMELSQDKIEGLRMAGSIHDIGKLSVPAEILSKPTKLTNLEFSLIKEHARTGYEMLKDVESPWPLAEIVYQHHERMDGSGYPRNLKGDEILIEARIMAVADVVESMASHRPYRPALGLNAALEEIEKNKGILYDDAVADTCLRLFREKGFQLENA
jgi:PAS domain S-box-containing protein